MRRVSLLAFIYVALMIFLFSPTMANGYWFAPSEGDGCNYQFKDYNGNVVNCKQATATLKGHEKDYNSRYKYKFLQSDHPWMVSLLAEKGDPVFGGKFNPFLMTRWDGMLGEYKMYGYATQYTNWLFDRIIKDPLVSDVLDIYGRNEWLLLDFDVFGNGFDAIKRAWNPIEVFGFTVKYKDGHTEGFKFRGYIEEVERGKYTVGYWKQSYLNGKCTYEGNNFLEANYGDLLWKFYFTNEGFYKIERSIDHLVVAERIAYQSTKDNIDVVVDADKSFGVSSKGRTVTTWGNTKR